MEWVTTGDGGAAFPVPNSRSATEARGMSLRDYFAGQAVIALGSHKAVIARGIPWLAEHAYMLADALLAQREK